MSRMDRYYKKDFTNFSKRITRNQDLYRSMYEDNEYSNIEGIAKIEKTNEVDITKIKNMLKNREQMNSHQELKSYIPREIPKYETFEREEDRVYDIRDILDKAKLNKEEEKYQSLKDFDFNFLNELKEKKNNPKPSLGEMVDTITNTSKLNKLSDQELGLNIFEDLKSDHNTVIQNKDSIHSILEEVKKNDEKRLESTNSNLDKSFFTSSMNFTDDDFEQIAELNKQIQKNSVTIKILIAVILIAITVGIIVLVFHFLK